MGVILEINGRTCVGHKPVDTFVLTGRVGKIAHDSSSADTTSSAFPGAAANTAHSAHSADVNGSTLSSAAVFNAPRSAGASAETARSACSALRDASCSTHSAGGIDVSTHATDRSGTAGPSHGIVTIRIGRFRIGAGTEPVKILGTVQQSP